MKYHYFYIVVQAIDNASQKLYAYMMICNESCNIAKLFPDDAKTHIIGANIYHTKKAAIEQVNGLNSEWKKQGRFFGEV